MSNTNTIIFDHTNHVKLWDWLVNNPTKDKYNWPEWIHNGGTSMAIMRCFACEYTSVLTQRKHYDCTYCPFGDFHGKTCLDGLFGRWLYETDPVKKSELAKQIRDLLIRKDIEVLTK